MIKKIDKKHLEEWGVNNLGGFIDSKIDVETNRVIVNFTKETIVLDTQEEYHDGELVATFYKEKNEIENKESNVFLADIDVYTQGITLLLTNGKKISLSINYEEECDWSGSYAEIPYQISLSA